MNWERDQKVIHGPRILQTQDTQTLYQTSSPEGCSRREHNEIAGGEGQTAQSRH